MNQYARIKSSLNASSHSKLLRPLNPKSSNTATDFNMSEAYENIQTTVLLRFNDLPKELRLLINEI